MQSRLAWRTTCAAMILMLGLGLFAPNVAVAPAAASMAGPGAPTDAGTAQLAAGTYNTLRVYGRDNEGAGDPDVLDATTDAPPEDLPYTEVASVFDPQGTQAPKKDFVTWDPVWMHEQYTPDENQSLYQQIYVSGINGSQKVDFRLWYEPRHMSLDVDADGVISESVDVVYPALMEEFTYQLTDIGYDPAATYNRQPLPTVGQTGSTQFVFPMAMRHGDLFTRQGEVDDFSGNAAYGYGLTSFDADFNGSPDIVQVLSENSLANLLGLGANWLDFDGDGVRDALDTDGVPFSGDELAVLALNPIGLQNGQSVMFLDYLITLQAVGDNNAVLAVRYVGDRIPDPAHVHTVPAGGIRFVDRHGSVTVAPNNGAGVPPVSPFFVQVTTVNAMSGAATLRIGRGLGASHTAMQSGPHTPDLTPGDPWFLKRFYVDGHEYDVAAIGTVGNEGFQFITIRTPVPKVPVGIAQHSVDLQDYAFLDWMSVMPPYNFEHFIFTDVQSLDAFPADTDTTPAEIEETIDYVGELVGPVAPILQRNGPFPYYGINGAVPYGDPREMALFYVEEQTEPQFLGELKERYGELAAAPGNDFWYDKQYWTQPWAYTAMVLPDISSARTGGEDPDLYLLTSAFVTDQSEILQWTQNTDAGPRRYNLEWDTEEWVRNGAINDFVTPWADRGGVPRVQFWFDPHSAGKIYEDASGLRVYGRDAVGPGLIGATEILTQTGYPVEVLPYSDPWAPFDPDLPEAPSLDSITFNPVYMSRNNSGDDPLRGLYGQISINGTDAREKAFARMWYEPDYTDKIRIPETDVYSFPALMQEFSYVLLDVSNEPATGVAGSTNLVFPMATGSDQLPAPDPATQDLPAGQLPSFGHGLTTFDANFDGIPEITRVHSENTLNQFLNTIALDFNGNGSTADAIDPDAPQPIMNGDEMVVLTVQNIPLRVGESAQFLDYMVTLDGVASTPLGAAQAQLQLWHTGGGLLTESGGYSLKPIPVPGPGSTTDLQQGDAAIAGRTRNYVRPILNGTNNAGSVDGGWFVYVHSVNRTTQEATVTIGRALGATYSAIDNGAGQHDLEPGDPWYLKRFFVDGHEYNVVAVRAGESPDTFRYVTIRTPVPLGGFSNQEDSQRLQGYFQGVVYGVDTDEISVMPPFNMTRSIAEDITALDPAHFAVPFWYDPACAGISSPPRVVPPLAIRVVAEEREERFFGELKEILAVSQAVWETQQFDTLPDAFADLLLPPGELYLLASSWRSDESIAHLYGCPVPPLNPETGDDPSVTWNEQVELAGMRDGDEPLSLPYPNRSAGDFYPPVPEPPAQPSDEYLAPYYDGLFDDTNVFTNTLRVKFWYDPNTDTDIYTGSFTLLPATRTIPLNQGWNLISFDVFPVDPAIASVLSSVAGLYDRVLAFDQNAGTPGLSYYPDLPTLSTLQHMDPYHGYWIHMSTSATLTVDGLEVADSTPLYLKQGWNLVSYLPESPLSVSAALSSIDGLYSVVLGWGNGALSYYPDLSPTLNTLQQLEPDHGYWIKMTAPGTLVYPEGYAMSAAELTPNGDITMPAPSNIFADFVSLRANFHGQPVPVGAVVEAYDPDGVLVGQVTVNMEGAFVIHVYGDDPMTEGVDEGAVEGDIIRFTVNGEPVTTAPRDPRWPGNMERADIMVEPLVATFLPLTQQ